MVDVAGEKLPKSPTADLVGATAQDPAFLSYGLGFLGFSVLGMVRLTPMQTANPS